MKRSLLALALMLAPAIVQSQQIIRPSSTAVISGVAVDSLRGGYLRGAIVSVSGTTLSAMTDTVGRFRIDSVPPGAHYLEVMHPVLDSLSLKVRTPPRELKAGDTSSLILAVPSAATIATTKCTPDERQRGSAVLLGIVTDADSDAPSSGAQVSVEWTDYHLTNRTLNKFPQRRIGTVHSDGTYKVCGIPEDLVAPVIAYRASDSTGTVQVSFERKLALVSFHLPAVTASIAVPTPKPADSAQASARGTARITGKVVDAAGNPLANARVAVEADNTAAVTDNLGVFRLNGLRTGTRSLNVRRIGFASIDMPVDVSAVAVHNINITMARYVAVLDAVRISAIRDVGLQRVGFLERQRTGAGKYIGPDEISKRNPDRLVNVLETVASLRMGTDAQGHRYVTGRHNGCVGYYVDGMRWFSTDPTDFQTSPDFYLSGSEIGAVEVYDEMSAPAEFSRISNRGEPCAVVVIWTKRKLGA